MTKNPENPSQDLIQERVKRDPTIGASVLLAALPDSTGFFTFPGPATCGHDHDACRPQP